MYFKELPEILYRDFLNPSKYKPVKNFFRRVRTKDDLNSLLTYTTSYTVQDGETPELVSLRFYNTVEYYWVILLVNNIIDVKNEWPMSTQELNDSIYEKYGDNIYATRYHETVEVRNSYGQVMLESGIIVNSNFTFEYTENGVTTFLPSSEVVVEVTNFEHEERLNERKRVVYIPRPNQINNIINQFETLIKYDTNYGMDDQERRIVDV
jgi:hypothetical protein